jgi:hypothetical protein
MFGMASWGAIRLDLSVDTDTQSSRITDERSSIDPTIERERGPTTVGLTWGGMQIAGFNPYVTIGFRTADRLRYKFVHEIELGDPASPQIQVRTDTGSESSGGSLGLQLGVSHETGLWGDFSIGGNFNGRIKEVEYDRDWNVDTGRWVETRDEIDLSPGGVFAFGLRLGYYKTFDAGPVSFGFEPMVRLGYARTNLNVKDNLVAANNTYKLASLNHFDLDTSLALGIKFQLSQKFALFTGAEIGLFNWRTASYSGGDEVVIAGVQVDDLRSSERIWEVNGVRWGTGDSGGALRFGMTFEPTEGLIIGANFTGFINNLVRFEPGTVMAPGPYWAAAQDSNNFIGALAALVPTSSIELTVSYQIPPGGRNRNAE